MSLIYAIILLGILIFIHELGHFLFAKLMGVRVDKFSIGFGRALIKRKYGETEYQLSAIPLGGYVKMLGEEPGEELSPEDRARAFNFKPVWKRAVIIVSGPFFNLFFATLIMTCIFIAGVPVLLAEVGEVMEGTPAEAVGIEVGDMIVEVDGIPIGEWAEMTAIIHKSPLKPLNIKVLRGEREFDINVTPEQRELDNIFGEKQTVGLIGIKPSGAEKTVSFPVHRALVLGVARTVDITVLTVVAIVKLFQRIIPAETVGGPILIVQLAGQSATKGAMNFFMFMAIISINLGIINLFPIPILDGGHLVFLGIEALRKKPLKEKTLMAAQKVGLALILLLMTFAFYNDILRVITGRGAP